MKIATWNVNSIRARHEALVAWLARHEPDVICLQETKVVDDDFPTDELLRLGYASAFSGQKTYNGVAILSREPMTDVVVGLHDEPDPVEKRAIRATIGGVRIYSVYVPNGKAPDSPSFPVKLRFLERLRETLEKDVSPAAQVAICGDFNIAPEDRDVFDPDAMRGQIHFHPDEHRALAAFLEFGLVDVYRRHHPEPGRYSWWDYRAGRFRRNQGLRIDFVFATQPLAERSREAEMDVEPRRGDKPSDHVPVMATFD